MRCETCSTTSTLFALILTCIVVGCQMSEDGKFAKLDREMGAFGLVLGDSLYEKVYRNHRAESRKYVPYEASILGHLHSANMSVPMEKRFLFGVPRGEAVARALDGEIYLYEMGDSDLPKNRVEDLRDSLFATYGEPSSEIDSMYIADGVAIPAQNEITRSVAISNAIDEGYLKKQPDSVRTERLRALQWMGEEVGIQFYERHDYGYTLRLYSRKNLEKLYKLHRQIDSLLLSNATARGNVIGGFDTRVTTESPLVSSESRTFHDYEFTTYRIPYSLVQQFFSVRNRSSFGEDSKAVEVTADFSDVTDSLTSLTVSMKETVRDPRIIREFSEEDFMSYNRAVDLVSKKWGEASLKATLVAEEGEFKRACWPGKSLSLTVSETIFSEEISFQFNRTSAGIGASLLNLSLHQLFMPSAFLLPWSEFDSEQYSAPVR